MAAKIKKIPMRLCVGCQTLKPKSELMRVLKDAEGFMTLDITGKKSGRGAYLCKNEDCFAAAKKGHRLERSFGCRVPEETYEEMHYALQKQLESERGDSSAKSARHLP